MLSSFWAWRRVSSFIFFSVMSWNTADAPTYSPWGLHTGETFKLRLRWAPSARRISTR